MLASSLCTPSGGEFTLTSAIRPAHGGSIIPTAGYRLERFRDPVSRRSMPVLAASVTAERLFEVFIDLLQPLGDTVDVILESSHEQIDDFHDDLRRSDIDAPVLASHLYDYEELLLNDGCAGVAVLAQGQPIEVQFDEHKLLYVYAADLKPFRRILRSHGIRRDDQLRLIAESDHYHHTLPEYAEEFRQLWCRMGAGDVDSVLNEGNGWSAW